MKIFIDIGKLERRDKSSDLDISSINFDILYVLSLKLYNKNCGAIIANDLICKSCGFCNNAEVG
ncbi:hypothetical protein DERF_005797 [Dermatophagoides farinae]|uniref:Uncharacterized protein n=1 Tax=Dermatophagoides farinae TaxID=6954 RepID=A0A922I4R9_DERFA|nr:hypothetical protein DERF_005797 [Dermatophagoides farinae]